MAVNHFRFNPPYGTRFVIWQDHARFEFQTGQEEAMLKWLQDETVRIVTDLQAQRAYEAEHAAQIAANQQFMKENPKLFGHMGTKGPGPVNTPNTTVRADMVQHPQNPFVPPPSNVVNAGGPTQPDPFHPVPFVSHPTPTPQAAQPIPASAMRRPPRESEIKREGTVPLMPHVSTLQSRITQPAIPPVLTPEFKAKNDSFVLSHPELFGNQTGEPVAKPITEEQPQEASPEDPKPENT